MFAIGFDLRVVDTAMSHPKGVSQAYADIRDTLAAYGFRPVQGSLYVTEDDSLSNLFSAILALKALPWLPQSVRDLRAFKVEHWSDFTSMIKS